jgi:phosphoglycerate dehydrogenase-like enzyme
VEPVRAVTAPLVVHVAFEPLGPVVDPARVQAISPGAEVLAVPYDLDHEQRTRRSQEPHAPDLAAGELELTPGLRSALERADVMVTLDAPLGLPALAPRLRWIQAIGSGVGQFVPSLGPGSGVQLTNAAGIGAVPIAEWVLARVLSVYKRLDEHDEQQRRRHWEQKLGAVVAGRRAVVVGLGAIGTEVAKRLRAFDVHVTGVRRTWTPGTTSPHADEVIGPDALLGALGEAHIVIVAAPGTAANEDLFDEVAFAAMRPGAVFVNVARGTLVDEAALMAALGSGHLRAAALDVTREEPLPTDSPLWDAPNLTISPHSSASSDRYLERVADLFYGNLERFVAGEPLANVVDLTDGY